MSNYKIKVNNESESKEAQELFFELGYYWITGLGVKNFDAKFLYAKNNQITMGYCSDHFSDSGSCEITLHQLRDMVAAHRKPTEQGLISGADAKMAWAKGEDVQARPKTPSETWEDLSGKHSLDIFEQVISYEFRLKPRTIKLELEIPACGTNYKHGQLIWILNSLEPKEYCSVILDESDELPAYWWSTEEEIKQVVAALRGVFK